MPERHHHQMTGVVGIEVEDDIDLLAPRHDEAVLIAQRRDVAERATVVLALALDVGHPLGHPDALPRIRHSNARLMLELVHQEVTASSGLSASGSISREAMLRDTSMIASLSGT